MCIHIYAHANTRLKNLSPWLCLCRYASNNQITTLPAGVFQGLKSLIEL